MSPQTQHLIRSFDRILRHKANTLHNLAKISQIESVMGLDWSWFQITLDLRINLEGSIDDLRVEVCNFSCEFALSEEPFENACENGLHRVIVEGSQGNDIEMTLQAGCNEGFTTSRGTHGTDKHRIDKVSERMSAVFEIVPAALIKQLTQDFNGRLRSIKLSLRHIEIVNKNDDLLTKRRTEITSSSLLNFSVNDFLNLIAARLS